MGTYIRASGEMTRHMALGNTLVRAMARSTRGAGSMTNRTGTGWRRGLTSRGIRVIMCLGRSRAKVRFTGRSTEPATKVSLKIMQFLVMENIPGAMDDVMKDIGDLIK